MPASDKEMFELLYAMLKSYYLGLVDGALRVNGFFLLAGGWLLTSAAPIAVLHENPTVRTTAVTLLLLAHGLYLLIAIRAFVLSRATARLLADLAYMPPKYYANHCIRPVTLALWYFTNLIVTGGIVSALVIHH
jgi:hypothetical protein